MKNDNLYLTTGEFAKLCHTSKHTLFHYYDIGLLTPQYTDDNGYRYYHVLQYDTFLTIVQLRTIGMSLADIKEYLAERSPQRMIELCQNQEKLLNIKISQLKQIKERIHSQKMHIEQALSCSNKFFMEKQGKKHLLCSNKVSQINDYEMTVVFGDLIHSAAGKISSNILGMTCKGENALNKEICPCKFYVYTDSDEISNSIVKPAGTYLTTYHHGGYETLNETYLSLLSYAQTYKLDLNEWIYYETIVGDWAVCLPKDYIIKVSVQIKESID